MMWKDRFSLRRLAELGSRGVVIRRRLPRDLGGHAVLVSPESALKYWRLDLESAVGELFDFARAHVQPGDRVWDIGANLGLFALAAASRAGASGEVVAVEPDGQMLEILRRSIAGLPPACAPIRAVGAAISDSRGLVRLGVSNRGRSSNHLADLPGASTTGGLRAAVDVPALTLDDLFESVGPPQVLKIDVETAELRVLKGARRLLTEARPVILIEVDAPNREAATTILKSCGYRLFDWDRRGGPELALAAFNTLALPT